jgi:hypothetical protein
MAATSKVPRGCFSVRDWNGDILIFDPRAPMTPGCGVIIHLRDDFRVRLVATYVQESVEHGTIRVRIDRDDAVSAYVDFDRNVVKVAKVVRVDRISVHAGSIEARGANIDASSGPAGSPVKFS